MSSSAEMCTSFSTACEKRSLSANAAAGAEAGEPGAAEGSGAAETEAISGWTCPAVHTSSSRHSSASAAPIRRQTGESPPVSRAGAGEAEACAARSGRAFLSERIDLPSLHLTAPPVSAP